MSVVSKNIFDLLGDDGESTSPAPAKATPAPAKKDATPAAPQRTVPGSQPRGGQGQGARGRGSYPSRGGPRNTYQGEPRNTGPVSSEGNAEGTETAGGFDGERVAPSRKGNQGTIRDAHTKGPRGNRPARGGGNSSRNVTSGGHSSYGSGHYRGAKVPAQAGERRQFERRNQNGGTDSQKKVDHGWGANTGEAELKDEVEGEKDAQVEENQPQTPAPEATEEVAAPAEAEPEEPEEVTKSYDDFLAERAQQALSIPGLEKKEARTVTGDLEGTAFVRSGVEEFFSGKAKNTESKAKAPKKEKVYIEVDGTFAQPNRPPRRDNDNNQRRGGGRGGASRGGQRGGASRGQGPRGGARGGRAPAGINANDTNAFPALGA
ncbi:hypothetical protein L486_08203 [Kwoniella mangroviensis CBS 10435]|uniref:Hyaluronan/mRNA-binding protein domain-containing protein n=1 Tax=Kwoniella mangroviensis CBS 10435 TaxID=1331196 RepID=A0A1B9IF72_9TREE|nr:uncharacterized protein I203_07844 [Kwoniella mangroviensis CBS 8507]OCF54289.1 hypothetical protein L486_08203 [Kwoniella mangroviensis CBS 10435]OCF63108.1 hypothetical protein I203_07844 [Kwoniella mangroviensis CBS 8507]OCF74020.1 hypothetical protein I204_05870 [Kwoniella mangroviensis CBS 8886]